MHQVEQGRMDIRREDGIAMIIAMMAMLLMTALGIALVLTTSSETMIANNHRNSSEALYAADAVLERAMDDILTVADWNKMIDPATPGGLAQSAFVDGKPLSDERKLPDGSTIRIDQAINMANCQQVADCTDAQMNANTLERPWSTNNPRWRAYAYGNLADMLPASDTINSAYYVLLLVADDPSENDNNPYKDGVVPCTGNPPAPGCNGGTGVLSLRAEAFGPRGAHKVLEVTVARTDTTELERGYTGQRGQDEQNRRARKSAVQTPGKALTMQTLDMGGGGIH
jgi:Tfp pilus assembly protein PilX